MTSIELIAPHARGLPHGGSQRSTALAERLEARGLDVRWTPVAREPLSQAGRLASVLRRDPVIVSEWPTAPSGRDTDVVVACQSYLARHLPRGRPGVIDFHNLEHRHLADVAASARAPRSRWLALQARLMEQAELDAVRRAPLSLFTSESERAWAESAGDDVGARSIVVPNRLPAATQAEALAIRAERAPSRGPSLVYVGTLRFPPNAHALHSFLDDVWPTLRRRWPGVRLDVAGGLAPPSTEALPRAAGVVHHGFVERLGPLLVRATAVVFPFAGVAGSSLRALYLASAGVPAIGPAEAFRGHERPLGRLASTPAEWEAAVAACLDEPLAEAAAAAADELQAEEHAWDVLAARLRGLTSS